MLWFSKPLCPCLLSLAPVNQRLQCLPAPHCGLVSFLLLSLPSFHLCLLLFLFGPTLLFSPWCPFSGHLEYNVLLALWPHWLQAHAAHLLVQPASSPPCEHQIHDQFTTVPQIAKPFDSVMWPGMEPALCLHTQNTSVLIMTKTMKEF